MRHSRSILCALSVAGLLSAVAADLPAPVKLTAQEDHKRTMDLLKIKSLRRGADGRNPQAPNAANYDESKANPYPNLPDPLVLKNGKKVTTAEMWWKQRRPEIVEDFDREIYGRVPKNTPKVKWEVTGTTKETVGDVPVVTKRLVGHVDNSSYPQITVDIQLTLTTPAQTRRRPVPVIMEFGFGGFGAARRRPGHPKAGPPAGTELAATGAGQGLGLRDPHSQQHSGRQRRGPDARASSAWCNKGQPRKVDDWGALRAWAWGASRALDYFETDKAVDAKQRRHRRACRGTARRRSSPWRTTSGSPSASSARPARAGVKLHRRNFGELVENVAELGRVPLDGRQLPQVRRPADSGTICRWTAHELVALCAPRPVFISVGSRQVEGDGWVDAKGMFLAGVRPGRCTGCWARRTWGRPSSRRWRRR